MFNGFLIVVKTIVIVVFTTLINERQYEQELMLTTLEFISYASHYTAFIAPLSAFYMSDRRLCTRLGISLSKRGCLRRDQQNKNKMPLEHTMILLIAGFSLLFVVAFGVICFIGAVLHLALILPLGLIVCLVVYPQRNCQLTPHP